MMIDLFTLAKRRRRTEQMRIYRTRSLARMSKAHLSTYYTWTSMKKRVRSLDPKYYKYYRARGIEVCKRWLKSFEHFLNDMGPRPSPKHSIDRIDNDGNYEPGNCRWATPTQQTRNRRITKFTELQIATIRQRRAQGAPLKELSEAYGISKGHISDICAFKIWKPIAPETLQDLKVPNVSDITEEKVEGL